MSLRRLSLVARADLAFHLRRPLTWILVVIVVLSVWMLASGFLRIQSGDSAVGGTKAWITSEFAVAQVTCFLVALLYSFFVAVAAGMAVIQDDERKVGEILHATPLTAWEYVFGKVAGILVCFLAVLVIHQLAAGIANHLLPNDKADEIRGPFSIAAYVIPTLAFGVPPILFLTFTTFAVGLRFRKPILVFVIPVAFLLGCAFFLWDWSPTWLSPKWNRVLMAIEPFGFRWLNETHLKVDRGVEFYNKASIPFDALFVWSRAAIVAIGAAALAAATRHFARTMRGTAGAKRARGIVAPPAAAPVLTRPLRDLAMRSGVPALLTGARDVARVELRELRNAPGLYLFVPLILLQTIGANWTDLGPFGTLLLATPGTLAVRMMNTLTLLVCLLLLFYTAESHQRERSTGFASIYDATPVRTGSILLGKSVANAVLAVVILVACFLGCVVVMLFQGKVPIRIGPFALVWGLLLFPTFLFWAGFVLAAASIARNRYATYGIGLIALIATGWVQAKGKMNWVFNWNLWSATTWTDMGPFELSRRALVMNRLFAVTAAVFFIAVAARFYGRREADPIRIVHAFRPRALWRTALSLAPWALVPTVLASALGVQVGRGYQSKAMEKKAHDYWKQNLATWKDAPQPEIVDVVLDLKLDPEKSSFHSKGTFRLSNHNDRPLKRFALTGSPFWSDVTWTLDGAECKPENRTGLYAFVPPAPIAPGDAVTVGFEFDGSVPKGTNKNGGGLEEFILPAGVVLTSFSSTFVPIVGYDETWGIEEDKNRYEPRVYPDDFYEGRTEAAFGSGSAFTARVTISGPEAYRYNSVGILESDKVENGTRTVVWSTDRKVRFFNVVAGKWAVKQGDGTAVYYNPSHTYNIDDMALALQGARTYYAQWFQPYPWKELKLSQFPGLATYAQGFPTNITFSESIGFLTREETTGNAAFSITAHEAAHQWWGNMVLPGKGPGGNLISEGMSHFSTILLIDQVKGLSPRIEFCKRIEERYGEFRQVDSEKAMVKIDGSKPGDTTVTYDKMGWVMWMLLQQMGRDEILRGLHDFQTAYGENPDHPVLQDLVAFLRPYAADPVAYDAFVKQWFFEVAVPEYALDKGAKAKDGAAWTATATVTNKGAATMPLVLAAAKGERFDDKGVATKDYADARETITLAKGETKTVTIRCSFEPERIVVDPDAVVLQLNRKNALVKL
jgi:ABC-type transport system involved in multi-copper enzyme maturation permease subunit